MNHEAVNPYRSPAADDRSGEPIVAQTAVRQVVTCHIVEDDVVAWTEHFLTSSSVARRQLFRAVAILGAFVFLFLLATALIVDFRSPVGLLAVIICVAAWLMLAGRARMNRRIAINNTRQLLSGGNTRNILGDIRYEVAEEGLRRHTRYSQSIYLWQGLEDVVEAKEHLFLLVAAGSAFVVPYRDFFDEQHRASFVASCKLFHEQSRHKPVPDRPWV